MRHFRTIISLAILFTTIVISSGCRTSESNNSNVQNMQSVSMESSDTKLTASDNLPTEDIINFIMTHRIGNGTLDQIIGFTDKYVLIEGSLGLWKFAHDMSTTELIPDMNNLVYHAATNQLAYTKNNQVFITDFTSGEIYLNMDYRDANFDTYAVALVFNNSGNQLAMYTFWGPVIVWDISTQNEILRVEIENIRDLAFTNNDEIFAIKQVGDFYSHDFEMWNLSNEELVYGYQSESTIATIELYLMVDKILIRSYLNETIIRDLNTGEILQNIEHTQFSHLSLKDDILLTFTLDYSGNFSGYPSYQLNIYDIKTEQFVSSPPFMKTSV